MPTTARFKPNSVTCCGGPASPAPPPADAPEHGPGHADSPASPSWAARLLLVAVRGYQLTLSPVLGGSCRYVPSCSNYMAEAVRRHGALRGGWLGMRRLARCHPFGASGFDPVPEARTSLSPSPEYPGGRLR